jgi:sarcosine oxidase
VEEVEFVVVGAGLLGLAAARALGRRGREVMVVEADSIGHERAGSKGTARIFRYGYEDPFYVRLAMRTHAMWHELEAEAGTQLLVPTPQLNFGDGHGLDELEAAMAACRAPCERLPAEEVARRHPGVAPREAVAEAASGVLLADRCLKALRSSACAAGVDVREHEPVAGVTDEGDAVRVRTSTAELRADTTILCAGPRTSSLTPGLAMPPHRATLEQLAWLDTESGAGAASSPLPIIIDRSEPLLYGLPDPTTGGYKVGLHHRGPAIDPNAPHSLEDDAHLLDELRRASNTNFPEWGGELLGSERCLYDTTPDEDFVLDRAGRIVVGCGTSGHGFKFGPLLGELLADLATGSGGAAGTALPDELAARFSRRR